VNDLYDMARDPERAPLHRRLALTGLAAIRLRDERKASLRPPGEIERRQRRRLRSIVSHAYSNVPYYRETMRRHGLSPADFSDATDLTKLPLIERDQLQRDPEYFADEGRAASECVVSRSGGSTATPVTVFESPRDLVERLAGNARIRAVISGITEKRCRPRVLAINPPMSSGARQARAYRRNLIKPWDPRFVELELSMQRSAAESLAVINDFRPHIVASLGSYLEELFGHAVKSGRPFHRPRVVVYAADSLSPGARAMLSEQLGIEVLSVYQAIETPQIGFECERHSGYHLNIDLCPTRIVDEKGCDLAPGQTGEVVTSNLVNRATVLLNYGLGDAAALVPAACGCGRTLPLLSFVEGRAHEWMTGAGGRRLHSQIVIRSFSLDPEIWGYRIHQPAPGMFDAEVIRAGGSDAAAVAARVQDRFASIVGPEEQLAISFVDSLPRTGAGKVKRVVSLPGESGSRGPGSRAGSASRGF
jgi:phenylacetate-CoA ligase